MKKFLWRKIVPTVNLNMSSIKIYCLHRAPGLQFFSNMNHITSFLLYPRHLQNPVEDRKLWKYIGSEVKREKLLWEIVTSNEPWIVFYFAVGTIYTVTLGSKNFLSFRLKIYEWPHEDMLKFVLYLQINMPVPERKRKHTWGPQRAFNHVFK